MALQAEWSSSESCPPATARACICCGERAWKLIYPDIVRCSACSHQRMAGEPTAADLEAIYARGYFTGEKYHDYVADKKIIQANLAARLASVLRFIRPASPGDYDLFEIGCAYGFFLELARTRFGSVKGIDISQDASAHARDELGLDVLTGDLGEARLRPESFDVVCMWDTIEHLGHPEQFVEQAYWLLRPGGLFFATTGDAGSLVARLQKRKWRLYDPPQHVHYFTSRSLALLTEQKGFHVLRVRSCAFIHSVEQIVHGLGMHTNRVDGVLGRLCRWLYPRLPAFLGRISFPIDLRDIVMIVGEKPAGPGSRRAG